MKVSIIGTAGRKEDITKMNQLLFNHMCQDAVGRIKFFQQKYFEEIELVSGGAAWADHVAVQLFLDKVVSKLTLYLPAKFDGTKFQEYTTPFLRDGGTANYYHLMFSEKMHRNTLHDILCAIENGANIVVNEKGFKARNWDVGKSDILIAYTWGEDDTPKKDSGTYHTWVNSKAQTKIHVPLKRFFI